MVVPVETASSVGVRSAFSFRKKLAPLLESYLQPLAEATPATPSLDFPIPFSDLLDVTDPYAALASMTNIDR